MINLSQNFVKTKVSGSGIGLKRYNQRTKAVENDEIYANVHRFVT